RPRPHRVRHLVGAAEPVARRVGRPHVAGGGAADHRGCSRPGRRRPSARARRRDESPVRGEVPGMTEPAWVKHAIWWQVYPMGFVGAYPADPPPTADEHRLRRIVDWPDHAVELGASGIALGPVFASRTHGYDTTDHYRIDPRLGDDADFDHLIAQAHQRGLRVLLAGGFNHVGTDFAHYREGDP